MVSKEMVTRRVERDTPRRMQHQLTAVIWKYRQNTVHHGQEQGSQAIKPKEVPHPLFRSAKPSLTLKLSGYVVRNIILGYGTFGTVYLATRGTCQVAVKTVHRAASNGDRMPMSSKMGEMVAMKRISHPNVQAILDTIRSETFRAEVIDAVVLELVTGGDLFSYVGRFGGLLEREVQFFAYQLMLGLQVLHRAGIAHRGGRVRKAGTLTPDIKPENILVYTFSTMPRLIISDLGDASDTASMLRRVPKAKGHFQREYETFGTAMYCPPEVLAEQSETWFSDGSMACRQKVAQQWVEQDFLMDVWALGCVYGLFQRGLNLMAGVTARSILDAHPYYQRGHGAVEVERIIAASEPHLMRSPRFEMPLDLESSGSLPSDGVRQSDPEIRGNRGIDDDEDDDDLVELQSCNEDAGSSMGVNGCDAGIGLRSKQAAQVTCLDDSSQGSDMAEEKTETTKQPHDRDTASDRSDAPAWEFEAAIRDAESSGGRLAEENDPEAREDNRLCLAFINDFAVGASYSAMPDEQRLEPHEWEHQHAWTRVSAECRPCLMARLTGRHLFRAGRHVL
jgi:serine/threonine protein kinase